jgi:hypothetical protein
MYPDHVDFSSPERHGFSPAASSFSERPPVLRSTNSGLPLLDGAESDMDGEVERKGDFVIGDDGRGPGEVNHWQDQAGARARGGHGVGMSENRESFGDAYAGYAV